MKRSCLHLGRTIEPVPSADTWRLLPLISSRDRLVRSSGRCSEESREPAPGRESLDQKKVHRALWLRWTVGPSAPLCFQPNPTQPNPIRSAPTHPRVDAGAERVITLRAGSQAWEPAGEARFREQARSRPAEWARPATAGVARRLSWAGSSPGPRDTLDPPARPDSNPSQPACSCRRPAAHRPPRHRSSRPSHHHSSRRSTRRSNWRLHSRRHACGTGRQTGHACGGHRSHPSNHRSNPCSYHCSRASSTRCSKRRDVRGVTDRRDTPIAATEAAATVAAAKARRVARRRDDRSTALVMTSQATQGHQHNDRPLHFGPPSCEPKLINGGRQRTRLTRYRWDISRPGSPP